MQPTFSPALALLVWLTGIPSQAFAQGAPGPVEPPAQAVAPATQAATAATAPDSRAHAATAPAGASIRFTFKGATFQQVIEFFSRATGLPVIWETPPPEGTLDYASDQSYDLPEALRVLNILLQSKGVMLRVSDDHLYLQKLDQMQKEDIPTFSGQVPAEITADQVITLVRPLKIALAKPLAEKLAGLVASYGSVTAMEQQNALVITETAANVRRILSIIEQLDRDDPEGAVEIFPIRHAKAKDMMVPLAALLGTRVEKFIVNEKGQQIKIEENQMPGLQMSADDRTNSIIAKGVQSRIDKLRESIRLLDVPATGQSRSMSTMALSRITPADATAKLNQLYQKLEEKVRPTVLALDDASKIMIIGDDAAVAEGSLLIGELENGPIQSPENEPLITVIQLEYAAAQPLAGAVASLLNKRQQTEVKILPGVDGKSLIIAGLPADVEQVKAIVPLLDRQTVADVVDVRLFTLAQANASDVASAVRTALKARAAATPGGPKGTVAAEPSSNSLIVAATPLQIAEIENIIKPLDAAGGRSVDQPQVRTVFLKHARAENIAPLVQQLLAGEEIPPWIRYDALNRNRQVPPTGPAVRIAADSRLNAVMISASASVLNAAEQMVSQLDVDPSAAVGAAGRIVRLISVRNADAQQLAANLEALFAAPDQIEPKPTIRVDAASNSLLVRATDAQFKTITELASQIDQATIASSSQMKLIPINPAKASAAEIAETLKGLLNRAGGSGGKVQVISLEELIRQREAREEKPVSLRESTSDLLSTPQGLRNVATGEAKTTAGRQAEPVDEYRDHCRSAPDGAEEVCASPRDAILRPCLGELLPSNRIHGLRSVTKATSLHPWLQPRAPSEPALSDPLPLRACLAMLVISASQGPEQTDAEPDVTIAVDQATNSLILLGSARTIERLAALAKQIQDQLPDAPGAIRYITLPDELDAQTTGTLINQAIEKIMPAGGQPGDLRKRVAVIAEPQTNALIIAANDPDFEMVADLLAALSSTGVRGERALEIIALQEGDAAEIARIVKEQFARPAAQAVPAAGLIVTADARTNSIIVSAPHAEFEKVKALIERLDAPSDADETIIRTYPLKSAQAAEAVRTLTQTLGLDATGRTTGISIKLENEDAPPVQVNARIVADKRSNSLIVTATQPSFPVIEALINKIEQVPAASPQEWRIIALKHAMAANVSQTLAEITRALDDGQPQPRITSNRLENSLVIAATADQFKRIEQILQQMDQPSQQERVTDFVPLKFAQAQKIQEALSVFYGQFAAEADTPAKKNVRIVADPATNSLVISAEKSEWDGVRALISRLDSAEYDSSLQLTVLPLLYADAQSVARAINDAFQTTVQRAARPGQVRIPGLPAFDLFNQGPSTTFVQADEWVRASAEPQTNSLIVSASRQNLVKVQEIVQHLDVADYNKLPAPQIISLSAGIGDAVQFAQSLVQLYTQSRQTGPGSGSGFPPLSIIGNAASNSIIVRAEKEDFEQIKTLADALQQQASSSGLTVRILRLQSAPAARVASSITEGYQAKARQANQPLSIRVDPTGNNLVIASTGPMFEEIKASVSALDAMAPAAGQSIFIIDLNNVPPETAKGVIETIGLDKPQPTGGGDSASRLVSEPIKVALLAGRNAIVVVANPADRETVVGLMKAIDSAPSLAEAHTRVIRLKHAQAAALAQILVQVLKPGEQQADTPLARAVREQVRRLSIAPNNQSALTLDLAKPIRVVPDPNLNAIVVSSTMENVTAIERLITLFDQLPITDTVTVQLFPLQNISAEQFARILKEIFAQGKQLGKTAITKVAGVPEGTVGKALLDELAVSTDDRTNTVIVAGTEEAVALVEVLSKRIDSDVTAGWVEPKVLPLRHADAVDLAGTLQAIIVEGATNLPQSSPLQRQIGRLRMARLNQNGGQVLESDVFTPMTRLIIRPEPQMNALILVGTPANIEVVSELVAMLDIESASPLSAVRIYPVENASASRIAQTIKQLFDQQVQSKAIRPEDRVIVQADERTNALVVATSPRSFAVLEGMLKTLDSKIAPELREIRTLEVKNASATRLASIIQQMMDARLERLRKVQPETADLERATVVADPRTNSLIVAAGNDTYEIIKRLAADLDTSTLGEAALVQVLPMTKGNVERVAAAINQIMARRYADMPPELRNSQRPLVLTDLRTNSLLVAANPEDMASIQDLVNKIANTPQNPAVGINIITLASTTRAELIAPRLQRLMEERQASLGLAATPTDRVTIEPDLASNSLIVASTDENLEVIRGLIDVLLQAESLSGAGREVEIVTLSSSSRAVDIVDMLHDLYVKEANRVRGLNTVTVTPDERINAVVINAPPGDVRALKDLIAQLDGAKPASVVEIKYVPLQSANAVETVSLIENVLSGRGIGARRGSRQATVLKYLREIAKSQGDAGPSTQPVDETVPVEMEVSAAIRESITLTPDLRTNTIIVSAPKESIRMIEQMIRDLDDSSTGSKNIRIFKLVNADALAMAELLTELFRLKQGSNLFVLKPREDQSSTLAPSHEGAQSAPPADAQGLQSLGFPEPGISGTELTAVPDERQQLAITVDTRTNSLIVSGTPNYLDLVAKVVEELDKLEANEREVYVYQLRNAVADDVARVIGEFVDQEQKKLVGTLSVDQLGSAARLLEREITIQGDKQSNTVLVSASPRYMERVKDMIKRLDVDPPQVLIQVMLAEVTLDTTDEFGVDLRVGGEVSGADVSAGFGLASAFVTGMGVPNLAIASSDFDLLIRAMKSQGRLQVLSNPSIMAANNAPARIQVGETIRLPAVTTISDTGQLASALETEDLGVILEVTPSINPDGFVRMTINPEISNLSARTTQISEEFQSPIITRRTADTTVTVHDGQTIVLGGLISDRYERRDRKVPFFSEIPLIGALFRSHTEETAKTELLIVLTPHVIDSPTAFDRVDQITQDEIDRLSLPDEVKDQIRRSLIEGTGGLYDAEGNRIDVKMDDETEAE